MVGLARLVPSLRGLLIFEAVARSGSCSAAAREFNLTQPSASRNIALLEEHLGTPLFTRSAAGMELTREGQMLYQALGDGFHRVEAALHDIAALKNRKDVVELSLSTGFVTHWLVPRLPSFHQAFPSVDLRFQLISSHLRGGPGPVDLAMRMKGEHDSEYHSWHFAPELIIPVCSPATWRGTEICAACRASPATHCCIFRTRPSIHGPCGAVQPSRCRARPCWNSATTPLSFRPR